MPDTRRDDGEAFTRELHDIIGGRIPAVLVPGPTVAGLAPYVEAMSSYVTWCGISKWWYLEEQLLVSQDQQIDVVWCGCQLTIKSELAHIERLLMRDTASMFISKAYGLTGMADRPGLSAHPRVWVADMEQDFHLNALGGMLMTLMACGYPTVITIGADGKAVDGKKHFGEERYTELWDWYSRDVRVARITDEMIRLDERLSAFPEFSVLNVSDDTVWTRTPTLPFRELPRLIDQLAISQAQTDSVE